MSKRLTHSDRTRTWYFKQPRDLQSQYSKSYGEWRRTKPYYEQKTFWSWLYGKFQAEINTFSEGHRHKTVLNPTQERQIEHKETIENPPPDATAYPEDTSTVVPPKDEYGETTETKKNTTEQQTEGKPTAEDKNKPENETEEKVVDEVDRRIKIALIVGMMVMGGVLVL